MISLLSFLCWISQSKRCCKDFFTVLTWQNSTCLPASPRSSCVYWHGGQWGLELLWGTWRLGKEGLVSGAVGTGAQEAAPALTSLQEGCTAKPGFAGQQYWEQGCCGQKPPPQGVETVKECK